MEEEYTLKKRITEFFRQTFRRHTGGEYSEFLTRGLHGERGVNKKYPWAYMRMFALVFVLLAIFLLIVRFTYNELFTPTIIVLASSCFNISILAFIYELYPKRDISILVVFLVMLLGGAAANVISQVLYDLFPSSNDWLNAVFAGLFEEIPKAVATLVAVALWRKREPLAGFLFGAAVGCGFSVVEDMGYIFVQANSLSSMNLTTVIEIAFSRGASSFCTHILWTAAVGWAFCQRKRYLSNIMLYPVLLLSCGLHIAWDLPLPAVALAFVYAGCAAISLAECIGIVHAERAKVFAAGEDEIPSDGGNADEDTLNGTDPEYWAHWGRFTVVVGAVLMSVIAVIYCYIPFRETYGTETFTSSEDFIEFIQDGVDLPDYADRQFDEDGETEKSGEYDIQYVDAGTVEINGKECAVTYEYWYGALHYPYKTGVKISDGETVNTYYLEKIYRDGNVYASFFRLTDAAVTGYNFESNGDLTVYIYDADFVRDLSDTKYLWLWCSFASIFGASAVCYVGLKLKSMQVKKERLLKNREEADEENNIKDD